MRDLVNSLNKEPTSATPETIRHFRKCLNNCQKVYQQGAQICTFSCPQEIGDPIKFEALMLDLSRGLLVKIFTEMAYCDRKWSAAQKDLAVELFKHVWGTQIEPDRLLASLEHVVRHAETLQWDALLAPFRDYEPLRPQAVEVKAITSQLSHLIASADVIVTPEEAVQLRNIQNAVERELSAEPKQKTSPGAKPVISGGQAIQARQPDPMTLLDVDLEPDLTPMEPLDPISPHVSKKARKNAAGSTETAEEELSEIDPQEIFDDAMRELESLIGLGNIKAEIHELVKFLKVQQHRMSLKLPVADISLHCVFGGNPGTGKTTVARILGRLFVGLGLLKQGHTIETDRSGLVAEYAGQTGPKTSAKIEEALDGVLFIDEAYSLIADKGDDPYGNECIQTLLKRMEDERKRLVVVLAGYPDQMDRMLKSNPGLSSRFQHSYTFTDYEPKELVAIFQAMCKGNEYRLSATAKKRLLKVFNHLYLKRDEHFGNGRTARNTFERAIRRLASRVIDQTDISRELLMTIEADDIQLPTQ